MRLLGGEIAEVSGFSEKEEVDPARRLLLAGRFEKGGVFQASYLPRSSGEERTIRVLGTAGQAEVKQSEGGAVRLRMSSASEKCWDAWDPWPAMVEVFDSAGRWEFRSLQS